MNVDEFFYTWPFSVVPDKYEKLTWAGRSEVRTQIEALLKSFKIKPQSTIDLIWASFGAGKTHLLYYMEQETNDIPKILPWYCVVPRGVRSFSEMYRNMLNNFPFDNIPNVAINNLDTNNEISNILQPCLIGTLEQKKVARDWIKGLHVDLRTARKLVYIPYKITKEQQLRDLFVQLINSIVSMGIRVLLLLDEFQRIRTNQSFFDSVNTVVLDTFNSNPRGFSVLISCAAIQQKLATKLLLPELLDRFRGRKIFSLPEFNNEEAINFVSELISSFRPPNYQGDQFSPFNYESLKLVIEKIDSLKNFKLIPRHIIQVLDLSLINSFNENANLVDHSHIENAVREISSLDYEEQ